MSDYAVPDGATARFLAGLDAGTGDIQTGVAQRLGRITPEEVEARRRQLQALMETNAGRAGHFTGNVLAPAAVGMAVPHVGGLVGGLLGEGATQAAINAMQPTGVGESALRNAATGAAGTLVGGGIGQGMSRFVGDIAGTGIKKAVSMAAAPASAAALSGGGSALAGASPEEALKAAAEAGLLSSGLFGGREFAPRVDPVLIHLLQQQQGR